VWEDASFIGFPRNTPAPANYLDWKTQNQVFTDMAALDTRGFNLIGDGEPQKVIGYGVTAGFFPLLGVRPQIGRAFSPDDDRPEAAKTVILSYQLWQSRYGGEHSILGRDILLNDEKHTVIGVMPAQFQFLASYVGLWVPLAATAEEMANRSDHYLEVVARLRPQVTMEQAQSDIETIQRRIARDFPNDAGKLGAVVVPLKDEIAGESRRALLLLLGAVGLVLMIGCANIASLLIARSVGRRREIAVRVALGAGRGRIIRQLLTESALLSVAGGATGLALAWWSFDFLRLLIPPQMKLTATLELDWQTLFFTLAVSLIAGLVFGLAPALETSRIELNEALKQNTRAGASLRIRRLQSAMVAGEIAIALVLLTGAGLLIRTVMNLYGQYDGLRPESLLTMRTGLPEYKYREPARRTAFYDQALERLQSIPGVVSAGYTTSVPLEWKGASNGITIEGRPIERGEVNDALHRQISAGYLKTMGIGLVEGRYFDETDGEQSAVAIVNETMARQYWADGDALGKRFKFGPAGSTHPWLTIVGVVKDVRQMGASEPVKAEMYFPYRQVKTHRFFAPRDLVIRTSVDPMMIAAAARDEIHAIDPDQPVSNIRTMEEVLGEEVGQRRTGMMLLAIFAGLALLLAAIGVYGVLSYFVSQHTSEIGLRRALGAQSGDILKWVMKRGMGLATAGAGVGLAGAIALTRLMNSLLFEVSAADPMTFAGATALLAAIAALACWIPARRATKVDPQVALRYE
jgi:putative ABC transport system permease protein